MSSLSRPALIASWIAQLTAAGILGQTLFFKFTAAPEAVHIFSTLGVEPWGRIGAGVIELITAVLLLIPRTAVFGALLALGTMGGAIMSHLFVLGIAIKDDGGLLFALALIVTAAASTVIVIRREQLLTLVERFRGRTRAIA